MKYCNNENFTNDELHQQQQQALIFYNSAIFRRTSILIIPSQVPPFTNVYHDYFSFKPLLSFLYNCYTMGVFGFCCVNKVKCTTVAQKRASYPSYILRIVTKDQF